MPSGDRLLKFVRVRCGRVGGRRRRGESSVSCLTLGFVVLLAGSDIADELGDAGRNK